MSLRKTISAYKKMKDKCNNLVKQSKKDISNKGTAESKTFWNMFEPFVTDKVIQTNENIHLRGERLKRQ